MDIIKTNFEYNPPLRPLDLDAVNYIIIHHLGASTATPEDINQWHKENGWSGFGYNEYIKKDGTVYIGRGDNVGAQCLGYNEVSYGIACEGDYDKEKDMPQAQFLALVKRIQDNIPRFKNFKCVVPHKQFTETECPGKYFPLTEVLSVLNKIEVVKVVNVVDPGKPETYDTIFDSLNKEGIVLHEKRFDDPVKRGELFAVVWQLMKWAIKKFVR